MLAGREQKLSCCMKDWEPFESSCYYFSKDIDTWNGSRKKCTNMNSTLVVITSETEQVFLIRKGKEETITYYKKPPENFCIGLSREETKWQWVDQTPTSSNEMFWKPYEPSSHKGEDCVVMYVRGNQDLKNWNNVMCSSSKHYYICETMPVNF
ncbi:C-type lectin domain family 4 member A-like [Hemicordylus capensis]|uniref:C-type lectin domain family 4 member A-like n=1 Tax=Hemicordylus capensis TaxID=884348 RepID=UPI0023033326|nr:C-type lectin domain family 4 member A-like [Hemicordylus capensis]